MEWSLRFFVNSMLLGVGLAMDAFSVSMANGLNEPNMKRRRMFAIAGVFAGFQALMPLLGWVCVHTVVRLFEGFTVLIPWIALLLLAYIGGKMLWEGVRHKEDEEAEAVSSGGLLLQGVATSIDALSVHRRAVGRLHHCGVRALDGGGLRGSDRGSHLRDLHRRACDRPDLRHPPGRQGFHFGRGHFDLHRAGDLCHVPVKFCRRCILCQKNVHISALYYGMNLFLIC